MAADASSKGAAAALALLVAFVPARAATCARSAALGAAILIAVQLTATHWFYLYIVWFVPFVLVALFAAHATARPRSPARSRRPEREAVFA